MQQSVTQPLGLASGELAVKEQGLGPGDQVVREQHEFQPDAVVLEVAEWQVRKAGLLVVADVVLDAGSSTVGALDLRDVGAGLVGEDRLEAVAVVVSDTPIRVQATVTNADVLGLSWGSTYPRWRPELVRDAHTELLDLLANGQIAPLVSDVVEFGEAPAALQRLADRRTTGKTVVRSHHAA